MKKYLFSLVVLAGFLVTGCQQDIPVNDGIIEQEVVFTQAIDLKGMKAGTADDPFLCDNAAPDYAIVVLSIDGVDQEPIEVPVFTVNGTLYTQAIKLPPGEYQLTEFLLYASVEGGDDIWVNAAPHQGTQYGALVSSALPIDVIVSPFTKTEIPVSILCYTPGNHEEFGFTWFRIVENEIKEGFFFGDFCSPEFEEYAGSLYGDFPMVDMPAIFEIHLWMDKDGDGVYETDLGTFNNAGGYTSEEGSGSVPPLVIPYIDRPDFEDFYKMDISIYELLSIEEGTGIKTFGYKFFESWYFVDDMSLMTKDELGEWITFGTGQDGVYDFIVGPCTVIEWDTEVDDPDYGDGVHNETAYAYGEDMATCFLEFGFSRWGWTNLIPNVNGAEYELPIYAGAGQCDISKGMYVGTLTISISGNQAVITYEVFDGLEIDEAHLYVGSDILLKKGKNYTVASGQFPYKSGELENTDNYSFTVDLPAGEYFYVVAHSVVSGMY